MVARQAEGDFMDPCCQARNMLRSGQRNGTKRIYVNVCQGPGCVFGGVIDLTLQNCLDLAHGISLTPIAT